MAWHPLDWQAGVLCRDREIPVSPVLAHALPRRAQLGRHHKVQGMARMQLSMFSLAEHPAKVFPSRDFARDWLTLAETSASPSLQSLDRYRPQWLLWENVPGVLSSDGGRDFGAFTPGDWGSSGMGGVTGFSMRNMSEWTGYERKPSRSDAAACVRCRIHLGDYRRAAAVYYLSAKACKGILRRADKRGKEVAAYSPSSIGGYSASRRKRRDTP